MKPHKFWAWDKDYNLIQTQVDLDGRGGEGDTACYWSNELGYMATINMHLFDEKSKAVLACKLALIREKAKCESRVVELEQRLKELQSST